MSTAVKNEIRVQLNFVGFVRDPREMTTLAGLTPSKTWVAGEPIERSARKYESNGWRISAQQPVDGIEAGLDALFEGIVPYWDALRRLSQECRVELSVVIYAHEEMPAIHFRADQIQRLAELHGKIDVDVYRFSGE